MVKTSAGLSLCCADPVFPHVAPFDTPEMEAPHPLNAGSRGPKREESAQPRGVG